MPDPRIDVGARWPQLVRAAQDNTTVAAVVRAIDRGDDPADTLVWAVVALARQSQTRGEQLLHLLRQSPSP